MAAASGQRRNSSGVTRFTEASVVCAESMVATTVVKGLLKSSCGCAFGYSWPMRRHTSTPRSRFDRKDSLAILPPSPALDCSDIIRQRPQSGTFGAVGVRLDLLRRGPELNLIGIFGTTRPKQF